LLHVHQSSDTPCLPHSFPFFFNPTAPPEIYTLSLHDALPIFLTMQPPSFRLLHEAERNRALAAVPFLVFAAPFIIVRNTVNGTRSEEHTSELQSRRDLVCRLLLEKKKKVALDTIRVYNGGVRD